MTQINESALLKPSTLPFGAMPFDRFKQEDFVPAVVEAIARAKSRLKLLKENQEAPTFQNTIVMLEVSSEELDSVTSVFFNLLSAEADEAVHALAKEISPLLAEYQNDVALDAELFEKIKIVYEKRSALNLTKEESKLLEKTYLSFVRNGSLLDEAKKSLLREIDKELSALGPRFGENVLKATNAFELELTKAEDLEGLPEGAIEAAKMLATKRGKEASWVFTLDAPSYVPVMTYAKNRKLREQISRSLATRCVDGEFNNQEVLKRIAVLRHQRAQLLSYETHADYVLEQRMAHTPKKVMEFLSRLSAKARPAALSEFEKLKKFALEDGVSDFSAWDFSYYAEKLKIKEFSFDEEQLRPYFKLENVVIGVFKHAEVLYGLAFNKRNDLPVYHSEVDVYEVTDKSTGSFVGLFYTDFFPRPTKKNGAWMTTYEEQGLKGGEVKRPHVSIVCNFTRPTESKPSLLSLDEVKTLFHEFGHALHGLLSKCTYRSVAGTNVYWDFVELPSQLMENWIGEVGGLDLFATHYLTGEKIPPALAAKIRETARFLSGLFMIRQNAYAIVDMAWHSADPSQVSDVEKFELEATAKYQVLPRIPGSMLSPSFSHIFYGGYSAGYYSYKWAEVLEADAFEYFQEKGIFDAAVARSYKENILERGGTEDPMELYKRFRGREPDADALLRRDGLL